MTAKLLTQGFCDAIFGERRRGPGRARRKGIVSRKSWCERAGLFERACRPTVLGCGRTHIPNDTLPISGFADQGVPLPEALPSPLRNL
jgi:hypothetical protein